MSRRKKRYGRLVPGPRFRTTPDRLQAVKDAAGGAEMTITQWLEEAIDEKLNSRKAQEK